MVEILLFVGGTAWLIRQFHGERRERWRGRADEHYLPVCRWLAADARAVRGSMRARRELREAQGTDWDEEFRAM